MTKVAIITGCSSGIGYKTALKFSRNHVNTYALVRNTDSKGGLELKRTAKDENIPLIVIKADVSKDENVKNAVNEIFSREKRIDILVNNAGFGFLGVIEDFSIEEIKQQYETNIFGMLRMVKTVIPIMRKQKEGRIINLSSINGLLAFPFFGVYSSSKYAIETLSEVLNFELNSFGIKVILVEPGTIITDFALNHKCPAFQGNPESPYKKITSDFFQKYNSLDKLRNNPLMKKIFNSKNVADTIFKAATSTNPKLRYILGIDSHAYLFFNKILPYKIWLWVLKKAYNWKL